MEEQRRTSNSIVTGGGDVITRREREGRDSLIRRQSGQTAGPLRRRERYDRRVSHLPVDGPSFAPDRRSSNLDMLDMARRAAASLQPEHLNTLEEYAEAEPEDIEKPTSRDPRKSVSKSSTRRDSNRRSSSQIPRSRGRRDSIGLATTPSAPQNYGQVQQRVEQESEVQPQGEYLGGGYKERLQKLARKSREVVRALNMNPYQRNAVDVAHMVNHVKKVKFFQSMPLHVTEQICRVAQYTKLQTDYCICKQNDEGDSFFVLLSGSVSVHVLTGNESTSMKSNNNQQGHPPSRESQYGMKVAVMTSGMCFGEVALICGQKRSATILAQEEGELLIITKDDYFRTLQRVMSTVFLPDSVKNCMHTKPALRRESEWVLIADIVQHHAFFDKISREVILEVSKSMQFLVLETKNRIYKQGDQARFLYIILTGTVELYRRTDTNYLKNQSHQTAESLSTNQHVYGGSSVPIGDININETYGNHLITLSSGDCFGDTEMYDGGNRNKTALTVDKTEMIVIDKVALMKLVQVNRALCIYPDRIRRLLGVQPNKRKPDDLKSLAYYTEALSFMNALTEANSEVVMAILRIAGSTSFSAGEVIVRQGERGSHFYIVFSGTVTMHQRDTEGGSAGIADGAPAAQKTEKRISDNESAIEPALSPVGKETIGKYGPCIRTISVGEGFGELNLFTEGEIGDEEIHSSTATCVAATDIFAMTLSEKDYNRIVRHAHEQETTEKLALLRQTQGLYSVPYNKLLRLCLHMTLETFQRGATLVDEGTQCKDIFFIKEGECRVGMTRSDPLELNSGTTSSKRKSILSKSRHNSIGKNGSSGQSEFEVALVGPCETVGDFAFFNGVLQPSTVRATRTTMAYKLCIDSLEKSVPVNILDGLKAVCEQRMQKQRERFLQASAIRKKIKRSSSMVKQQNFNEENDGIVLDENEVTNSQPHLMVSKSPELNPVMSRSSSRLPHLRAQTSSQSLTSNLSKTIEAALSAFKSSNITTSSSSLFTAVPEQQRGKMRQTLPETSELSELPSIPSPMPWKVRRKFNIDRESNYNFLPSGPPDPLRERSIAINHYNDADSNGIDGSQIDSDTKVGDDLENAKKLSNSRPIEYDSKGRRVHEGLKMFEVDVPNGDTGCARLRYVVSDSQVPKASEEYKRQLVYDYTREHLSRIAKKKVPIATM